MDKYIKQIQTRMNRRLKSRGQSVTKQQVRDVYSAVVKNLDKPTDVEMSVVIEKLAQQVFSQEETLDNGQLIVSANIEIEKLETIEITPESNPDIWETLQPPATEQEQVEIKEEAASTNSIVPPESHLPAQQQPTDDSSGLIPHSEVAGMVSQAFNDQPPQLQQQITEYAMERTFTNVREVQSFLEQMRSMEFDLMVKTLQDHFARRGNMLSVLGGVLKQQVQQDERNRSDFFDKFHAQMNQFQQEMEMRLSKQGL